MRTGIGFIIALLFLLRSNSAFAQEFDDPPPRADTSCFYLVDSIVVDSFYVVGIRRLYLFPPEKSSWRQFGTFISFEDVTRKNFRGNIMDFSRGKRQYVPMDDFDDLAFSLCEDRNVDMPSDRVVDFLKNKSAPAKVFRRGRYQLRVTKIKFRITLYGVGYKAPSEEGFISHLLRDDFGKDPATGLFMFYTPSFYDIVRMIEEPK